MADQATVKVFIESDRASVEKAKKELEKSFGTGPMGIQPKIGGSIDKGFQKLNKVIDSEMNSISSKAKTLFLGIGATITGTIGLISGLFAGVYKATRAGAASLVASKGMEMSLIGQGMNKYNARAAAEKLSEQEKEIVVGSGKTAEEIRKAQQMMIGAGRTDYRQIGVAVKEMISISVKSQKELSTIMEGYSKMLLGQTPGIEGTKIQMNPEMFERFKKMSPDNRFFALRNIAQGYLGKEGSALWKSGGEETDPVKALWSEIKYIMLDMSKVLLQEIGPSAKEALVYLNDNKEDLKAIYHAISKEIVPTISAILETIRDVGGASSKAGGLAADAILSGGKFADRAMALPSSILASAAKLNERNPLQREFCDANSAYLMSKARGDDPRLTARLESAMYRSIRKRNQEIELRMKIKQEPERMPAPHGVARKW